MPPFFFIQLRLHSGRFLTGWIAANFVGGFLVSTLENNGLSFAATIFLTGLTVGTLQWWVLRQAGGRLKWWPLASAVGWIAGILLWSLAWGWFAPELNGLLSPLALGEKVWGGMTWVSWMMGMAIAQALIMGRHSRFASTWLVASFLGSIAQDIVQKSLCAFACQSLSSGLIGIVHGLGWAVYAVITGLALLRVQNRLV